MEFHDLHTQYLTLKEKIDAQISDVLHSGQFILGSQVTILEEKLAVAAGRKYCISCANGTDALVLVLMAWGIGSGDAVFTSDFTFFASAGCASSVGATPVPVDIDPRTFNISPEALEEAIISVQKEGKLRPRVIIAVDIFGQPADYPRIEAIAKKYNLLILEDAAQGFGGRIGTQTAGSFGQASTTSFFPAKPLGCYGDGGAIFTDNAVEAELLCSLRSQGRSPKDKYDNRLIGMNSRLDTLQAAILLPKLDAFFSTELSALNHIATQYSKRLHDLVQIPFLPEGYTSSWAQYSILLKDQEQRNDVRTKLMKQDIPTMIYYPRGIHQQSAYAKMKWDDKLFPHTLQVTQCILALPMHPYLTSKDVAQVCDALHDIIS